MIHKNIWKPDTCNCEIEYEWDDAVTKEKRIHTCSRIIKACPFHIGLSDKIQNYNAVLDENKRKNILYGKILENIPTAVQEKIQDDGTKAKQLKPGLEYKWSFDKDRNLVIELPGFTTQQKNTLKAIAGSLYKNKAIIK